MVVVFFGRCRLYFVFECMLLNLCQPVRSEREIKKMGEGREGGERYFIVFFCNSGYFMINTNEMMDMNN